MDQADLVRAYQALQLNPHEVDALQRMPYEHAVPRLKAIQERVKARYKKLAFELHPDRTGGDSVKTKLFSDVTELNKKIQELQVRPPPPRQQVFVQVVHYPARHPYGGAVNAVNYGPTSTTNSPTYHAARVAYIKFV